MREIAEYVLEIDEIVRAAVREAIWHEREMCAKCAENRIAAGAHPWARDAAVTVAEAIRART